MKHRNTAEVALSLLLSLQVLVALALAVLAIANFPALLEQFGMTYQRDMGILQVLMTYNLCLSMSICLLAVFWIRSGNVAGLQAGAMVGALMLVVSIIVFLRFGRIDILLFDGVRALLKVTFAALAYGRATKSQPSRS